MARLVPWTWLSAWADFCRLTHKELYRGDSTMKNQTFLLKLDIFCSWTKIFQTCHWAMPFFFIHAKNIYWVPTWSMSWGNSGQQPLYPLPWDQPWTLKMSKSKLLKTQSMEKSACPWLFLRTISKPNSVKRWLKRGPTLADGLVFTAYLLHLTHPRGLFILLWHPIFTLSFSLLLVLRATYQNYLLTFEVYVCLSESAKRLRLPY